MRIPVFINGDIPMADLSRALQSVGFHIRIDAGHRFIVDRVPKFVSKSTDDAMVIPMKARK